MDDGGEPRHRSQNDSESVVLMKVVELRSGFGFDALAPGSRPDPKPGPRDVVVKMRAASLNYRDLQVVRGEYPGMKLPFIPLSDGAGEVVEIGRDVERVSVGDRVCPCYVQDWLSGPPVEEVVRKRLGSTVDGVLAEYVCVPEHGVVRYPRHLAPIEAATLPIAAVTAWHALFVQGKLAAGETLVVQGTGGVATFALQLAKSIGAEVIVTSSSDQKLARARALGATHVVNYTTSDFATEVLRITGGRGAEYVIDIAGGENLSRSISAAKLGGTVAVIGYLESQRGHVDIPLALRRMVTLHASSVGSRSSFEALIAELEMRALRPVVDRIFPLSDVRGALEYLASGVHVGKIAISFGDESD